MNFKRSTFTGLPRVDNNYNRGSSTQNESERLLATRYENTSEYTPEQCDEINHAYAIHILQDKSSERPIAESDAPFRKKENASSRLNSRTKGHRGVAEDYGEGEQFLNETSSQSRSIHGHGTRPDISGPYVSDMRAETEIRGKYHQFNTETTEQKNEDIYTADRIMRDKQIMNDQARPRLAIFSQELDKRKEHRTGIIGSMYRPIDYENITDSVEIQEQMNSRDRRKLNQPSNRVNTRTDLPTSVRDSIRTNTRTHDAVDSRDTSIRSNAQSINEYAYSHRQGGCELFRVDTTAFDNDRMNDTGMVRSSMATNQYTGRGVNNTRTDMLIDRSRSEGGILSRAMASLPNNPQTPFKSGLSMSDTYKENFDIIGSSMKSATLFAPSSVNKSSLARSDEYRLAPIRDSTGLKRNIIRNINAGRTGTQSQFDHINSPMYGTDTFTNRTTGHQLATSFARQAPVSKQSTNDRYRPQEISEEYKVRASGNSSAVVGGARKTKEYQTSEAYVPDELGTGVSYARKNASVPNVNSINRYASMQTTHANNTIDAESRTVGYVGVGSRYARKDTTRENNNFESFAMSA